MAPKNFEKKKGSGKWHGYVGSDNTSYVQAQWHVKPQARILRNRAIYVMVWSRSECRGGLGAAPGAPARPPKELGALWRCDFFGLSCFMENCLLRRKLLGKKINFLCERSNSPRPISFAIFRCKKEVASCWLPMREFDPDRHFNSHGPWWLPCETHSYLAPSRALALRLGCGQYLGVAGVSLDHRSFFVLIRVASLFKKEGIFR